MLLLLLTLSSLHDYVIQFTLNLFIALKTLAQLPDPLLQLVPSDLPLSLAGMKLLGKNLKTTHIYIMCERQVGGRKKKQTEMIVQ